MFFDWSKPDFKVLHVAKVLGKAVYFCETLTGIIYVGPKFCNCCGFDLPSKVKFKITNISNLYMSERN